MAQTTAADFLPAATGQNLGNSGQRWNLFANALDLGGGYIQNGIQVDVRQYGAKVDGVTDDTAAVQSALNAVATGGVLTFPAGTCLIAGTVSATTLSNVTLLGYGTVISGTSSSGPAFKLGSNIASATNVNNVQVIGFKFTNGAWTGVNGAATLGQSTQNGLEIYCGRKYNIDVTGENVGGAVVLANGYVANSIPLEWSRIRVKAFDCGIALSHLYGTSNQFDVIARRMHQNGAYINNSAQLLLNITSDETLQPSSPATTDGIGLLLIDTNWSSVIGSVGLCQLEALKMLGNCQWNTISGLFYNSSVKTNVGTSNIVLDANGGASNPKHNMFFVYAGYDATAGGNRPAYGIAQTTGSINTVGALDATGCGSGTFSGALQMSKAFTGPAGVSWYYNPANVREELHGLNNLKFDIDTDNTAGGTPAFIVSQRNGAANLINCTATTCIIPGVTVGASGTAISKLAKYTATLTPVAVAANTTAAQTFTITGVAVGDTIVSVVKPTAQAGLGIVGWYNNGTNSIGIVFANNTASPITPTASELYAVVVIQ